MAPRLRTPAQSQSLRDPAILEVPSKRSDFKEEASKSEKNHSVFAGGGGRGWRGSML